MTPDQPPIPRRLYVWLVVVYLASGFPFGLFQKTARIHLGRLGVSKVDVGLLSLLALPWTLKFLWAPIVDRRGTRRSWISGSLAVLCAVVALYAVVCASLPLPPSGTPAGAAPEPTPVPVLAWALLALLAFASATQDVAIDGFAVETFPGRAAGNASGLRVNAYRLAFLAAGGLLLGLVGALGWRGVWFAASGALGALSIACAFLPSLPRPARERVDLLEPFLELMRRPGFAVLAAFVLLFKVGDYALSPMADQWLIARDGARWGDGEVGLATTLGLVATIAGGLLGGWLTTRWGVFRALWTLGALQAVSNLAYAGAALAGGPVAPWAAALVEPFCGGLGTAPFAALLMVSCARVHAGTQYAILSAIFGLARELSGALSGLGAERFGWVGYFTLTFVAALPAFALLPWVRRWTARREAAPDAAEASAAAD